MSYLLDKKIKRRRILNLSLLIIFLLFGIYFRNPIFNKLSAFSHFVFRPVVYLGNSIGGDFSKIGVYFSSKSSLLKDKQNLTDTLNEKTSTYSNYSSLLEENTELKEILGRKNIKTNMVLASILSKPNTSLYDTLIIDAGFEDDISLGSRVFAYGNVPIGKVAEVFQHSAKVILFSNPREKTEVVVSGKNIFIELVGRGGGNFEMATSKDLILEKGTEVVLPGINPYTVAIVEKNISDPRDSFDKVLLVSPINIQEIKFVQVEK